MTKAERERRVQMVMGWLVLSLLAGTWLGWLGADVVVAYAVAGVSVAVGLWVKGLP